jgi:siroheme synthase-like protein
MAKYPIFLELTKHRAVVIGGGNIAFRKAQVLYEAGADVLVVAKSICDCLQELCDSGHIKAIESAYEPCHLEGARLVIAATDDMSLNEQVYADCQANHILCNVVDIPHLCDFYVPAIAQQGSLQIAIGTDGKSPAYAGYLRRKFEAMFTEKHGQFLEELHCIRVHIIEHVADPAQRKALLKQLVRDASFEVFLEKGSEGWTEYAHEIINGKT